MIAFELNLIGNFLSALFAYGMHGHSDGLMGRLSNLGLEWGHNGDGQIRLVVVSGRMLLDTGLLMHI